MTNPFATGTLQPGVALSEVVTYVVAAPEWDFAHDPNKAVTYATGRAVDAEAIFNQANARRFTWLACLLIAAADNPHIPRGAVLTGLVEQYGEPSA